MTDLQIYLDTTVLVVFLFAKHDEPDRYVAVEKLFGSILRGEVTAVVSFYAFPELYGYVVDNFPQNVRSTTIRHGFLKLFAYPVEIATFVNRIERRRLDRKIDISDPADFLHVASALSNGCSHIITYDSHFDAVRSVIKPSTPEELLAELAAG